MSSNMVAKIDLTPLNNIENHQVVNPDNVITLELPWEFIVTVYNRKTRETDSVHVKNLSMYDHYIYVGKNQYHPIGMLSRTMHKPHGLLCTHGIDKRVCTLCN